jgi:hypothetical protein
MAPYRASSLYNATYTLYRQSPFHASTTTPFLSTQSLDAHARRLGDALRGDVLRGVRVALDERDDGLTRSGVLLGCRWTFVPGSESTMSGEGHHGADGFGTTDGIKIEFEFEKTTHTAWMLRTYQARRDVTDNVIHFPLLAVRMPHGLLEMFLSYLGSAFDTRVELLHISSSQVGSTLETYIQACQKPQSILTRIVRDVQLSFSFKGPIAPSLRNLDITIQREDLARFLKEGRQTSKAPAKPKNTSSEPFLSAVSRYLEARLALDTDHKDISLSRIACGGFALGKEGKVKIFRPLLLDEDDDATTPLATASREATTRLLGCLVGLATTYAVD